MRDRNGVPAVERGPASKLVREFSLDGIQHSGDVGPVDEDLEPRPQA